MNTTIINIPASSLKLSNLQSELNDLKRGFNSEIKEFALAIEISKSEANDEIQFIDSLIDDFVSEIRDQNYHAIYISDLKLTTPEEDNTIQFEVKILGVPFR